MGLVKVRCSWSTSPFELYCLLCSSGNLRIKAHWSTEDLSAELHSAKLIKLCSIQYIGYWRHLTLTQFIVGAPLTGFLVWKRDCFTNRSACLYLKPDLRLSQRSRWCSSHPSHDTESIVIYYKGFERAGCFHLQGVFTLFVDGIENGDSNFLCNVITYIKVQMAPYSWRMASFIFISIYCPVLVKWQMNDGKVLLQSLHFDVPTLYSILSRPTNAQLVCINNILYTVSTATCFDASASSSGVLKRVFSWTYKNY